MPSLPVELERMIFELAALQDTDHDNRVRISLVAKRVHEWMLPILYRVAIAKEVPFSYNNVCVTPSQILAITIQNWRKIKITDVGRFVRHLLTLTEEESYVVELLSAFRNVENLAMWHSVLKSPQVLELVNDLPLRILSTDLDPEELEKIVKTCPVFKNITHLEIIAWMGTTLEDCEPLIGLPNLTHLCLDIGEEEEEVVLDLLKHCPSLQALIYLVDPETLDHKQCTAIESSDPRLLVLRDRLYSQDSISEWERSANGQIGLWELADKIIEARKDKLFKDRSAFTFSRKTWMDGLNDDGVRWYKEWSGEPASVDK